MNDPLKEIGLLIKSERQILGLTLEDLAHESRVSSHHIANLEDANREALPEDTFLFGFLNKIFKALKLKESAKIIEKFKKEEGEYLLQFLVEENFSDPKSKETKRHFFKIYYLYILLSLFLLILGILLVNNFNKDNEKKFLSKQIIISSQSNDLIDLDYKKEEILEDQISKNQSRKEIELLTSSENDAKLPIVNETELSYKSPLVRGKGEKSLSLRVKEVAWVQVLGAHSQNILFEGDVFPSLEPNQFIFHDKEGFILATGNAGAFEVDTGEGLKVLGESGQLIKWYYPKAIKRKLIRVNRKKSN
jgi:cytoskeletal protein RodZ